MARINKRRRDDDATAELKSAARHIGEAAIWKAEYGIEDTAAEADAITTLKANLKHYEQSRGLK